MYLSISDGVKFIPASLLHRRLVLNHNMEFLKTKMSVALKLERPVKMNLSTSIVSDLLRSKEFISTALDYPAEQCTIFISLSTCINFRGELLLNLEFRVPFVKFCKIT